MAVKNLGMGIIERLIKEREQNGLYTSVYDFCFRFYSREFNRKSLEGLIKSGAMDGLGENRRQMLYNIEGVLAAVDSEKRFSSEGQLNLFDEMGDAVKYEPQIVDEMPKEMLLSLEKEATGLYLSGHPLDEYAGYLSSARLNKASDIAAHKCHDGEKVTVAGLVSGFKVRQLKNNNLMGSGFIEGIDGSVPITVFAAALSEYRTLLTSNEPLVIIGRISEREDRDAEIVVDRAEKIPESAKGIKASKYKSGLYLKVKNTECEEFQRVKGILENFHGSISVFIYCTETKKKLEAPERLKITPSEPLFSALGDILGKENVKFIK